MAAVAHPVAVPHAKAPAAQQQQQPKKQVVTPGISLLSGACAGAIEASVTYPFEFAKTRAQLSTGPASKNPFAVIAETARSHGVGAIYTGSQTLIAGTAAKAGVRFLSFDAIKNALSGEDGKLSAGRAIFAGMVAGAVESVTVVTPTERLKTALIDDARSPNKRFNNGLHAIRILVKERGVADLYRGLLSTTMKQSATSAVRMGSYSIIKESVATRTTANMKNPLVTFGMGAAAGVITVYATQPFDTIKTRSQGARGISTTEAVRDVWRTGIKSFWSGSTMRLGRLVLSGGIVFSAYENISSFLVERASPSSVSSL